MTSWIGQDICFCVSEDCPIREYCFRAIGCKSKIYTVSYFADICNHSNVYAYYIQAPMDLVEEKRNQRKKETRC